MVEVAMRILTGFQRVRRKRTDFSSRSEALVATLWLVFYVVGIALAGLSPIAAHMIELASH
jgi:hypothetical protein